MAVYRPNSVLLDIKTKSEEWRQCVCQIQEAGGRNDADEAKIIGDGGGDDKSYDPPYGDDGSVQDLAAPGDKGWCVKNIDQNIVV